ncbi:MAG: hypothetical protein KC466_19635 [Myxococcales bacterium]|nr:hypothetical protein [Myxococcales bacterium]
MGHRDIEQHAHAARVGRVEQPRERRLAAERAETAKARAVASDEIASLKERLVAALGIAKKGAEAASEGAEAASNERLAKAEADWTSAEASRTARIRAEADARVAALEERFAEERRALVEARAAADSTIEDLQRQLADARSAQAAAPAASAPPPAVPIGSRDEPEGLDPRIARLERERAAVEETAAEIERRARAMEDERRRALAAAKADREAPDPSPTSEAAAPAPRARWVGLRSIDADARPLRLDRTSDLARAARWGRSADDGTPERSDSPGLKRDYRPLDSAGGSLDYQSAARIDRLLETRQSPGRTITRLLQARTRPASFSPSARARLSGGGAILEGVRKAALLKASPYRRVEAPVVTVYDARAKHEVPARVYEAEDPGVLGLLVVPEGEGGAGGWLLSELGLYAVAGADLLVDPSDGAYAAVARVGRPLAAVTSSVYANVDQRRHYTVYASDPGLDIALTLPAREPIAEPRTYLSRRADAPRLYPLEAAATHITH